MALSGQRPTVVGAFDDRDRAARALDDLRRAGFRDDQIGLAIRHQDPESDAATTEWPGPDATEGARTGALTGGALGALLGAVGSLLVPGVGPVIAAGILAAALGGAVAGADAGTLVGSLVGLGIPEEEARYYDEAFQAGQAIVTVQADGRSEEATAILRRHGAGLAGDRPAGETDFTASVVTEPAIPEPRVAPPIATPPVPDEPIRTTVRRDTESPRHRDTGPSTEHEHHYVGGRCVDCGPNSPI